MVIGADGRQGLRRPLLLRAACETLVTAYATGRELRVVSDAVARQTVADWESYPDMAERHFAELKARSSTTKTDSPGLRKEHERSP